MRTWWLIAALFLTGALLALQVWALEEFLYWQYPWFDLPMHYLGGLSLGVLAVGFIHGHKPRTFALSLLVAFVAWEVFEFSSGLPHEVDYALDTAIDLVMDTLGALSAYAIARMTIWRK